MTATNNFGGLPQEFGRHNFSRVSSQRVLQIEAIVQELDYLVNQVRISTLMSCTQYVLRWHWHADRLERLVFCSITICIAVWNGVTSYGINRDLMHQTSCVPTGMARYQCWQKAIPTLRVLRDIVEYKIFTAANNM